MTLITKNLGFVKAIYEGTTPPANILMLWYDTTVGVKFIKYYDTNFSVWKPLRPDGAGVIRLTGITSTGGDYHSTTPLTAYDSNTIYLWSPNITNPSTPVSIGTDLGNLPLKKVGGSSIIDLDVSELKVGVVYVMSYETTHFQLISGGGGGSSGGKFFEKSDKYSLVYSSISQFPNGAYKTFDIDSTFSGYCLQMELNDILEGDDSGIILTNNVAWNFNFIGSFLDGACVRLQPTTLGASKCNVSDYFLTSGKTYDFVYNLELDSWSIDELQNLSQPQATFLPMYVPSGSNDTLYLTNTNHTYIFKIGNNANILKKFFLLPTHLWRGRKITILIQNDVLNNISTGPFFYVTPYSEASGTDNYVAIFQVPYISYPNNLTVWVKIINASTSLVELDAGAGSKKVYVSGIQGNAGDFSANRIYQFTYNTTLDTGNGGWNYDKQIAQQDLIEGETYWRFPYGVSGIKKGSYVVFGSDGFGNITIEDQNIII